MVADMSLLRGLAGGLVFLAGVAGIGGGLLAASYAPFTCFDMCPPQGWYVATMIPLLVMAPFAVLAVLTLAASVGYLRAAGHGRAARTSVVATGVVVLALGGFLLVGRAQIATASVVAYEDTLYQWIIIWGIAVALISALWIVFLFGLMRASERTPRIPGAP